MPMSQSVGFEAAPPAHGIEKVRTPFHNVGFWT